MLTDEERRKNAENIITRLAKFMDLSDEEDLSDDK